jgi:apolipoprotein N-acyltransferase
VWRLSAPPPAAPGVTVVLVQGNVAQGQKWNRALLIGIFERYLDLTRQGVAAAGTGAKVVVWPETASPFQLTADPAARAAISDAAGGATVLAGTVRFDTADRPRNALAVVEPGGALGGVYDKWHLVPFGEFQPTWFPLPFQVVPGGGFAAGDGPATLTLPGLPAAGPIICYEAIYSGELVDPAARPGWLVNITNDAWFGNSSGPRQHLAAARLRAVEEGLPLMRAANTGITAGFDAYGREINRLPTNRPGVLDLALPGALAPTVYARAGLAFPVSLALVSLSLAVIIRYFTRG